MKLNVGCDTLVLPKGNGWINHDHRGVHPDVVVLDVRSGLPYADGSIEEIYGGNFFDHLGFFEGIKFLQDSLRVLVPGGAVKFSLMDTDRIINAYLYGHMDMYSPIQPGEFAQFKEQSLKFGTFVLGNLARAPEYTGHKMLYTPMSFREVALNVGFKMVIFHPRPDFTKEPWSVENKEFANHVFYVEAIK